MAYQPIPIDTFGGLKLADDPEEVGLGQAVDLLNVDVSTAGRLRPRPGTADYISAPSGTHLPTAIHLTNAIEVLVGFYPDTTRAVNRGDGSTIATDAGVWARQFVSIGTPTTGTATYFTDGTNLRKWASGAFTAVAGPIDCRRLALSPTDNRLVIATYSLPDGGLSRIAFSDAGAPETFTANNYVDLDPGDGERIIDVVTFEDKVFAFKQTKFYVFTGDSIGPTGNPIFNYRAVRAGVGAVWGSFGAGDLVTVTRSGVYFVAQDGIYLTTGGNPVKVSGDLDPWFRNDPTPLAASLPARQSSTAFQDLSSDHDTLYYRNGEYTFAYRIETGRWTLYGFKIYAAEVLENGAVILGVPGKVVNVSRQYTTDSGTPISWTYRSGSTDLGSPVEKLVKQTQVWGSGTVTASVYTDHNTTDPAAATLTLGTAPAVDDDQQFYSRAGTFFSLGLSGTGPAVIHRAVLGVAEQRLPGMG